MSVPDKVYNWNYQLNETITKPADVFTLPLPLYDAYNKKFLGRLVELLMATDNTNDSAWTYVGGSVGASVYKPTSGQDTGATDPWTVDNCQSLVFGTAISGGTIPSGLAPGNWIVLKRTNFFGSGAAAYLTLALGSTGNARACTVYLSTHRPDMNATATTATVRPAPTGPEITYRTGMTGVAAAVPASYPVATFTSVATVPAGGPWVNASGMAVAPQLAAAPVQLRMHMLRHASGFRFIVAAGGKVFMAAIVEKVQGVGDTATSGMMPAAVFWESRWNTAAAPPTTSPLQLAGLWKQRRVRMTKGDTSGATNNFEAYLTQETFGGAVNTYGADGVSESNPAANDLTGEYPLLPTGLYSNAAGSVGRHGYVQDLYWGSETFLNDHGANYPDNGDREWVQFGSLVFPWDGSAISLN